jgi:transposase
MYRDVAQWARIRKRVLTGGSSLRQVGRETGISRKTVRKMVDLPAPPGYQRRKSVERPKLGPYLGLIDQLVEDDQAKPAKQRHTASGIWECLKARGFTGGFTIVKDYLREARRRVGCCSKSNPSITSVGEPSFNSEDPARVTYELIQGLPKREAIRLLRLMSDGCPPALDLTRLEGVIAPLASRETGAKMRLTARQFAFDWMRRVLQGELSLNAVVTEVGQIPDLDNLLNAVTKGRLSVRNRALTVLARERNIGVATVCAFLGVSRASVLKYCRRYREGGINLLMDRKVLSMTKANNDSNKQAVFSLLHIPPSTYGVNRTTWRMTDLQEVLRHQGFSFCKDIIRRIIKQAGYKWRKARIVLTSTDPEYRTKVDRIKQILSELGEDEAFFSIDEYGPFAVKRKGGKKRVAPGERYVVPQWQKSKGWMIITAALELSRNQVTHFYSRAKDTDEMIKMADLLRNQYHTCRTIYLSWDAASWHISKRLLAHLEEANRKAANDGYPIVRTAPLPAGAQFLNVIESVFSGMARAIIHNSDYWSLDAAKNAIDLYFTGRNEHFSKNPKRAGGRIWRNELVASAFLEGQNCKDPLYCR